MIDYGSFFSRAMDSDGFSSSLDEFDVFVSAYNASDRVRTVFANIQARRKIWLVHPEYKFLDDEIPNTCEVVQPDQINEIRQVSELLDQVGCIDGLTLGIDCTGFMRSTLCHLLAKLDRLGADGVVVTYAEPRHYLKNENTEFSTSTTGQVRPVHGMSGGNRSTTNDHLLISMGYDHALIGEVSGVKDSSIVHPLFAFPSLSADMYQQSAVRAAKSGEVVLRDDWITNRIFAPANDPFATAQVVSKKVNKIRRQHPQANVYIAPLSTKAHTIGMALFWILECGANSGVSLLLPECERYSRETSVGIGRIWAYTIEFRRGW